MLKQPPSLPTDDYNFLCRVYIQFIETQIRLAVTGSEVPKSRVDYTAASAPDTSQALPIYTHLNG